MFKLKNNKKIGEYLEKLIDRKYEKRAYFCRAYIAAAGEELNDENIRRMANRISQMIKGNKAVQTYDLPIFSELLGVTCEQILSAGDYSVPLVNRVTNYYIANSKDPEEWEEYINRADKLILNSDEYCKTVLDYALEFRNYEFLKYLMDNKYIWFDCMNDKEYILNFGPGTSIKRDWMDKIDSELQQQLMREDILRTSLIMIAAGKDDIEMLKNLRARECTQLYHRTYCQRSTCPESEGCYTRSCLNQEVIKRIASSSEKVLDYFTDPFEIPDKIKYKDGSKRVRTYMFPYISKLLDIMISKNTPFTERALNKALKYNKETYNKLCRLILLVKNDEYYSNGLWVKACKDELDFYENGDIVSFRVFYSTPDIKDQMDGIITNVAHVTKFPTSSDLKQLAKELNESYEAIKNLKEHLEDI